MKGGTALLVRLRKKPRDDSSATLFHSRSGVYSNSNTLVQFSSRLRLWTAATQSGEQHVARVTHILPLVNAISGVFCNHTQHFLLSDPSVLDLVADGVVSVNTSTPFHSTNSFTHQRARAHGTVPYSSSSLQTAVPYNLDRIDQRTLPLDGMYRYGNGTGAGVRVYVLDTGVRATHVDFEGRVISGYSTGCPFGGADCPTGWVSNGKTTPTRARGRTWTQLRDVAILQV